MSTVVGHLKVLLGLDSAQFTSGRKQATKQLDALNKSVQGIQRTIMAGLAALGITATVGATKAYISANMAAISSTADFADRIGITTEALIGLRHAAGLGGTAVKDLDISLQRMTRRISASQDGGGIAASLRELGLEARTLASLAPDQQFKAIADGMQRVGNHSDKVRLAFAIFDSGGVGLLNAMQGGAAAIEAAQKEAERLGITFSRLDAEKVGQAEDAMARLGMVTQGVGQTLAIELSPFITAAANRFMELATSGDSASKRVTDALGSVMVGVGHVADYLALAKAGFHTLQAGATAAVLGIVKAIDWAGDGLVKLINLIPGMDAKWSGFTGMFADELERSMEDAWAAAGQSMDDFLLGRNAQAAHTAIKKIKSDAEAVAAAAITSANRVPAAAAEAAAKAMEQIASVLAGMQKEIDTFGMSASQKKIFDLEAMGASPDQIAAAQQMVDKLDALTEAQKRQQDMAAAAKSIWESTRTPMEIYENKIGQLSELLSEGAIDWDTYGRAVRKAREELEGIADMGRSATQSERMALLSGASVNTRSRPGEISIGGQRVAAAGGNGKIKVDGTEKTNKLLTSIDAHLAKGMVATLA